MSDYGFFWDSRNGDRKYGSSSMEEWLRPFFKTGVFDGQLQVTATTGMGISVAPGYCNVEGKVRKFEQAQAFTLQPASGYTDRVDNVVIERNEGDREIQVKVVTGATTTPLPPVRENGVYQLVLARIAVDRGATSITQSVISDTRMDGDLCGWVAATVEEITFSQIMAQFNAWMDEQRQAFSVWMNREKAGFLSWKTTQQDDFSTWRTGQQTDFESWKTAQKDDFASWRAGQQTAFAEWMTGQQQAFLAWMEEQKEDFSGWRLDEQTTFSEWRTLRQNEFDAWLDGLQEVLDEETAGHLQLEIEDLQTGLGTAQSNISALQTGLGAAQEDITDLREAVGNAGHDIYNESGPMAKRKGLQFQSLFELTDDSTNDRTLISSPLSVVNGQLCVTFNE